MKKLLIVPVIGLVLMLAACPKLANTARDTAASLNGLLTTAQGQYAPGCKTDPTQQICSLINKGVDLQNALISATQTYCGWSAQVQPTNPNQPCVPVQGAAGALQAAIANANQIITELKGVIH